MPIRRRTLIIALAVLVAATAFGVGTASGEPSLPPGGRPARAAPPAPDRPLTLAEVGYAVDQMAATYGIGPAEALRRLELQRHLPALHRRLAAQLPDAYAGLWIDQEHGGEVVIHATDPRRLDDALAGWPDRRHVRPVEARFSLAELRAAEARVRTRLGPTASRLKVGVDVRANAVVVNGPAAGDAGTEPIPAPDLARQAAAGERVPVKLRIPGRREAKAPYSGSTCRPLQCDPPMRGGMRLDIKRDNGTWGGCTNGFNVHGSNGWRYTLTAGHCVLGANHTQQDSSTHNGVTVGKEDRGLAANHSNLDYALMPYWVFNTTNFAGYWSYDRYAWNLVARFSDCLVGGPGTNPGYSCGYAPTYIYRLLDTMDIPYGLYVCTTGTATADYFQAADGSWRGGTGAPRGWHPGTRCGIVTDVFGFVWTNLCTARGDSGGPLFTPDGSGIGILSDGSPAREGYGNCERNESSYSPLLDIFDDLRFRTGLSFSVNP